MMMPSLISADEARRTVDAARAELDARRHQVGMTAAIGAINRAVADHKYTAELVNVSTSIYAPLREAGYIVTVEDVPEGASVVTISWEARHD